MKSISHCSIVLAVFAFVNNAFGGYNAPSSSSGGGYNAPNSVMAAEQLAPAVKNGICLPRDFASTDPELNEAIRSYKNGQGSETPMTMQKIVANSDCHELPYGRTLLHDFNDQVADACNLTPTTRATCYALAGLEYLGVIPKGTVLNVDGEHNVKFVCANGEEYAFDRNGKLIPDGINEGTFNLADPEHEYVKHIIADMLAAVQALPRKSSMTKDEFYSFLEEYINNKKNTIDKRNSKNVNQAPISVDDLKSMNLDDPDGDWCQCVNPGCVNTFHLVNGKHDGYLTFECSKCKKVNVGFAKEAIRYAQILESEGTQPKWFGQNAEARANAAGMAK